MESVVCGRLSASRGDPMRVARTVLALIGPHRYRDLVHRICRANKPAGSFIDVSSATDAVLMLLTEPVDMVLVDAALAGDLLSALTRHARRSAPNARLAIFGNPAQALQGGAAQASEVLPWVRLEATLVGFLRGGSVSA